MRRSGACLVLSRGRAQPERDARWLHRLADDGQQLFAQRFGEYLHGAGLSNIVIRRFDLPTGSYGGRLGALMAANYASIFRAYRGIVAAQGVTTQEQWDETLAAAQEDLNSSTYQCVIPFFVAYGQRPG